MLKNGYDSKFYVFMTIKKLKNKIAEVNNYVG